MFPYRYAALSGTGFWYSSLNCRSSARGKSDVVRRNSVYDEDDWVPNGRGYMLEYGFRIGCGGRLSAGGGGSL